MYLTIIFPPIYIIAIAGAELAIGLGILVAFYRLRGSIAIEFK